MINYEFPHPSGRDLKFIDFNFKLLTIEEFTYNKKTLKPIFDVYDFAKQDKKRKINSEEEGYEMIPEVPEFFKKNGDHIGDGKK